MLNRVLRAAAWGYAGSALKIVMQLGVQVILARMLGPHEYGLFAIGVMVVSFAIYFGDLVTSALITRKKLDPKEVRFAFTWQIILSVLVAGIVALLAGPIAVFVNDLRAEWVVRILGLICIFNAMGGVALALLRRNIDFKAIQIAQVTGYFVGYVVLAIPYAIFVEPSVTALVIAWIGQVLVTAAIYIFKAPHSFRPLFSCANGSELVQFGLHSFLANMGTWSLMNIDKMVVARFFSTAQVGLYSTASNLLSTPLSLVYSTLQQLMFSSTAQLERNRAGDVLSALVALVVVFVGLAYIFTFTMAEPIILLLYGSKWHAAVPFIEAFSVTMFFNALSGVVTPLLWAQGAVRQDAKIQVLMAILIVIGAITLSHWSVVAIAWWVAMVYGFRTVVLLAAGLRLFPEIRRILFVTLFRGAFFLVLAAISFSIVDWYLREIACSIQIRFITAIMVFAFLMLGVLRCRMILGGVFSDTLNLFLDKLPRKLSWLFGNASSNF